jgi:hypothetical protein
VVSVAKLHNANRKRARCTASGDGEEKREGKSGMVTASLALDINSDARCGEWRVTMSDQLDMICPPNERCPRLAIRQSSSSSASASECVLCAVHPH